MKKKNERKKKEKIKKKRIKKRERRIWDGKMERRKERDRERR